MKFILPCLLLVLTGCAGTPVTSETCGPALTDAQIEHAVRFYVDSVNWKDPESVHIRNVQVHPCASNFVGLINGGHLVGREITFEVNAKNSYGGFTGYQSRWIVQTADGAVHTFPASE